MVDLKINPKTFLTVCKMSAVTLESISGRKQKSYLFCDKSLTPPPTGLSDPVQPVDRDFRPVVPVSLQLLYEEVLSHSSPLETIATKGSSMAEHCATQQEVQQLQSRYDSLKDKAKVPTVRATYGFLLQAS